MRRRRSSSHSRESVARRAVGGDTQRIPVSPTLSRTRHSTRSRSTRPSFRDVTQDAASSHSWSDAYEHEIAAQEALALLGSMRRPTARKSTAGLHFAAFQATADAAAEPTPQVTDSEAPPATAIRDDDADARVPSNTPDGDTPEHLNAEEDDAPCDGTEVARHAPPGLLDRFGIQVRRYELLTMRWEDLL